jgi:hypothetical protein
MVVKLSTQKQGVNLMESIKRINSAVFKAGFSEISEDIKRKKDPVIVQRNNKDLVAVIPVELLQFAVQRKQNDEK